MYFYDCLVVVNRDRVLFHNDTNLLSFFEFCHTSMPGGATLFSKTWLTKQKHDGMTFGEWGDQASSEGPHKLLKASYMRKLGHKKHTAAHYENRTYP